MIDIAKDELLDTSQVAALLRCSARTVTSLARVGKRGVRLEALLLPTGLVSTRKAVDAFVAALSPPPVRDVVEETKAEERRLAIIDEKLKKKLGG